MKREDFNNRIMVFVQPESYQNSSALALAGHSRNWRACGQYVRPVSCPSSQQLTGLFRSYQYFWCGPPQDGEFKRLTEEKRRRVIEMFMRYLHPGGNTVAFSKFVFAKCFLKIPGQAGQGPHYPGRWIHSGTAARKD